MPYMVNGIGTTVYGSRGDVRFGSYNAMEWFVFFRLPLIPIRAMHTFDWNGLAYRFVPLRWSLTLVARTFLGAWRWVFLIVGIILLLVGSANAAWPVAVVGLLLGGLFAAITCLLVFTDRRTCDIRRVLGPHASGSCDPALLANPPFADEPHRAEEFYGAGSFAEAVDVLMRAGRYSQAMWAARLATVLEDATLGESLTDQILTDPEVAAGIEKIRKNPNSWSEVMLTPQERAGRGVTEVGAVPAAGALPGGTRLCRAGVGRRGREGLGKGGRLTPRGRGTRPRAASLPGTR